MPAAVPVITAVLATTAGKFIAAVAISLALGSYQQSRARKKAREAERAQRDAYNASLKDRHITVRSGVSTRKYVLGTVRVGGTLMHIESNGHHNTALDSVLALAANKCELQAYYIADDYVPADQFPGDKWGKAKQVSRQRTHSVPMGRNTISVDVGEAIVPDSVKVLNPGLKHSTATFGPVSVSGSVVTFECIAERNEQVVIAYSSYETGKLRVIYKDGSQEQNTDGWPDVATPMWTSEHRLRGIAYLRTLNLWDDDLYHAGAPQMGAVLRGGWVGGHRFFDSRTNTYPSYTTNPAILAAWYMTLPRNLGGMGIPESWVDWPCVSIAANICDEQIRVRTLDGQGYESIKRYECHTLIDTGNPPVENLNIILSSMAGEYVFTAGVYRIFAGAFRTAAITITDDDVVGDKDIVMDKSGQDDAPANIVTSTFINASRNWLESSPRPIRNDAYLASDGAESPLDLPLPATTDERQAAYLMGVALESARPSFAGKISVLGVGEDIAVLDTVQLRLSDRPKYAGRTFLVINRIDNWDGTFELTLQETRANVWALDPDTFLPSDPTPTPDTSYLWNIAPVVGFTVSPQKPQALADGVAVVRVDLSWDRHQQPYVLQGGRIETRYRAPGDEWIWNPPASGDAIGTSFTATLVDGVTYQYQARAVSGTGATSNWTDGWNEYDGIVEAPPALTGLSTESILAGISVSWSFPGTSNALRHTQIRYGKSSEFDSSIKMGDYAWPTDKASLLNLSAGAELFFWGRLVDENSTAGPWYPAENMPGIRGQASADVGLILDELTQDIIANGLGDLIMGNILDIPNIRDTAGSALAETGLQAQKIADNAQAIAKEVIDRGTAVAAEAQARIDGQTVAAQALADGLAAEARARGAAITTEKTERQTADASLSSRIDTVTASAGANAAAIQQEAQARATGDSAEANARQTLAAQLRGGHEGSDLAGVTSGLIAQEKAARTSQYEGLARQMTLLSAGVGEQFDYARMWYFTGSVEGWSRSTLVDGSWIRPNVYADPYIISPGALGINGAEYTQARVRVRKVGSPIWGCFVGFYAPGNTGSAYTRFNIPEPAWDADGIGVCVLNHSFLSEINQIIFRIAGAPTTEVNHFLIDWIAVGRPAPGASSAALATEGQARATADAAEATSRERLSVKLIGKADPTGVTLPNVTSGLIFDERQARVSGDEAAMTEISGLKARMPAGTGKVATEASVTAEAQARATADTALASRATALESRMPTGTGKVATAEAVDTLTTRVEQAEGKQTSTASDVTQLKTSVITAQNTANSAQSSAAQAKTAADAAKAAADLAQQTANQKADASALTATNARVTAAEGRLTSTGESITRLDNSIANLAGAAGNLLKSSNRELVRAAGAYAIGSYQASQPLEVGKTYTLVACITHQPAADDAASSVDAWTGNGGQRVSTNLVKSAVKKVVVQKFVRNNLSPTSTSVSFYYFPSSTKSGAATIHWACLYDGDVIPPLEWQPSQTEVADAIAANVTAVDGLTNRVTATENGLTAAGQRSTVIEARIAADQDSDSLIPDYLMANPDCWYSHYGTDLSPRFVMTETGKIAPTVFRHTTGTSFNYSRTAIPTGTRYRVRFWARRSTDSNGSMHITIKHVRPNGSSGAADYTAVDVRSSVSADEQWHLVDRVVQPSDATFSRVQFGFSANHTGSAGWAEIQGYRVTAVIGTADINPSEVATAQSVSSLSSTVSQQGSQITSQGQAITALQGTVNHPTRGVAATADAVNSINIWAGLVDNKLVAQAQSIQSLTADIGTTQASVQTISQAQNELDGRISASYAVKTAVNVNGVRYVSGFGLDTTTEGGVTQTTFAILAGRFAVMHDVNGAPQTVFSVQGGAAIFNAALIAQAAIKSAQIESLDARKIETPHLAAVLANIDTAYIKTQHVEHSAIKRLNVEHAAIDTLRIAGNSVGITAFTEAGFEMLSQDARDIYVGMNLPHAATVIVSVAMEGYSSNAEPTSFTSHYVFQDGVAKKGFSTTAGYSPSRSNETVDGYVGFWVSPAYVSYVFHANAGYATFMLRQHPATRPWGGSRHFPPASIRIDAFMR